MKHIQLARSVAPSDGWFKPDTHKAVERVARMLLRAVPADEAEALLSGLIGALRSEYGE